MADDAFAQRLHPLTFVSLMHTAGKSLEEIGDYVGHSSAYMADRYRHLPSSTPRAATRELRPGTLRQETQYGHFAAIGRDCATSDALAYPLRQRKLTIGWSSIALGATPVWPWFRK